MDAIGEQKLNPADAIGEQQLNPADAIGEQQLNPADAIGEQQLNPADAIGEHFGLATRDSVVLARDATTYGYWSIRVGAKLDPHRCSQGGKNSEAHLCLQ